MHILIIRPGAIGDTLLTFPVIQALRARYTNPRITLVSNPAVLPLAIKFGLAEEVSDYGQLQWSDIFSPAGIQQPTLSAQLRQVDLAICWLRDASGIVKHNLSMAGVKNVIIAPGRPPAEERGHIVDYLARSIGLDITDTRFHLAGAAEVGTGSGDPCGRPSDTRFHLVGAAEGLSEVGFLEEVHHLRRGGRGWVVERGPLRSPSFRSMARRRATARDAVSPETEPHPSPHHPRPYGNEAASHPCLQNPTSESPCGRPSDKLVGAGEGERGRADPCGRPSLLPERNEDEVSIAVHPGSGGANKCWPVPCFAETIKQLWEHNCNVLVLIGPADHTRWAELQKLLPAPPEPAMLKVMIDAPLTAVAEQVQQCRCYLGNDAGITHLAAMLGVPTIVLFGPSDPAIWQPVGPSVEILQAEAFAGLPVIIVRESILRRLNK